MPTEQESLCEEFIQLFLRLVFAYLIAFSHMGLNLPGVYIAVDLFL